ncbi:hypothetical protein BOTBODRAFT_171276 [Botryobasidium botryosum FD-172 SS1]|uniref:Endonuclease/exonuclease/phosphatase domain-containing protein n=1 Tax=Botryobasidium botryosum (strain FD-172 SS1) TaxID=930990 RepID=A0A067MS58_BOTB1|nr:hypothetical protein BOTBODRAFT_171276 [Botryobasidium botryosum FD-172 SS1]
MSTGPQFETHGSLPGRGIPRSYAGFRVIRPPGFGMPMLYPTVDPERFAVAFIIARSIPNLSLDAFVQLVDERFPLIEDECNPYYLHLAYLDAVNCWECEGIRASEELGLRAWMLPEPDLFTRDFNACHRSWAAHPRNHRNAAGTLVRSWIDLNLLRLLNPHRAPTFFDRRRGIRPTCIDLVLANPLLRDTCNPQVSIGKVTPFANHARITTELHFAGSAIPEPSLPQFSRHLQKDVFEATLAVGLTTHRVALATTNQDLDKVTSTLMTILAQAAKASSPKPHKGWKKKTWWNKTLAKLSRSVDRAWHILTHTQLRDPSHLDLEDLERSHAFLQRKLQYTIRDSKRLFFGKKLEAVTETTVWDYAHWGTGRRKLLSPPLKHPLTGEPVSDPNVKAKIFHKAFFSRDDIAPTPYPSWIPQLPTQPNRQYKDPGKP